MSSPTLPDILRQLACLAELRGSQEAVDLRSAVALLDTLPPSDLGRFEHLARRGRSLDSLPLPPSADWRIREIVAGGADAALRAARSSVPVLPRRLLELGAVTHDQALALARDAGVLTLADLQLALEDGRLARLPEPQMTRLRSAAAALDQELPRVPLGRAFDIVGGVAALLRTTWPEVTDVTPSGELRRYEALVSSLSLAARASDPGGAIDALCGTAGTHEVLHRTARRAILSVRQTEVDVRIAGPDDYGTVLFAATGSPLHVAAVTARRRRLELCAREEDVYARAGLQPIPPELRNGADEVEAAARHAIPKLVERADLRGDLHMHSTYSDGMDPMDQMIAASAALGYEYVAITDHSENAGAARTVTLDQLARQRDEIARLRERHPEIAILHGIEVDILPDGRLDFADAILEPLDIVLASLHDAAGQDGAALTRRCLQAIRHPLVNIITHPANRLVGRRAGYPMDYEAIYEAAAETGTALEIDGAPSHLDMDGEHARAAVAAGVTVTIDSDSHRASALERQMQFGIGMARRGWVEPRHVLNCRPVNEIRAFVEAKRGRKGTC